MDSNAVARFTDEAAANSRARLWAEVIHSMVLVYYDWPIDRPCSSLG
jgi:hypothetical protein